MKKISVIVFSLSLVIALTPIMTACQPIIKQGRDSDTSPLITRAGKPHRPVSHYYLYIPVTGTSEFAPMDQSWLGKVHLRK